MTTRAQDTLRKMQQLADMKNPSITGNYKGHSSVKLQELPESGVYRRVSIKREPVSGITGTKHFTERDKTDLHKYTASRHGSVNKRKNSGKDDRVFSIAGKMTRSGKKMYFDK